MTKHSSSLSSIQFSVSTYMARESLELIPIPNIQLTYLFTFVALYSVVFPILLIFHYFTGATLFTQIMFLNMLIAIMGETFGSVSEAKERSALMERTHLYADFMWAIRLTKALEGKRYLYVVR
jgi:hypothetical protein